MQQSAMSESMKQLVETVRLYRPEKDLEPLFEAYRFARAAHEGQKRLSGEAYISHPIRVATILAELRADIPSLVAALLHDVVEDTDVRLEDIEQHFGKEVAGLVDGVTKLGKLPMKDRVEAQAENLRKMLLAMAKDIRVIMIKLADRLHNMRTLSGLPANKQQRIARETLEIYAPLAHRLGIYRIKWELEDLGLRYTEPAVYRDLAERIPRKRKEREAMAEVVMDTLRERLQELQIQAEIEGRAKNFYSIYQKMKKGKDLSQIYDLIAVRVIVNSIRDCYAALGVVHTVWRPLPGRFKDYIATPKSNMYQSLHTTVVGPLGEPFEIQIRTWDMHRTAEYGIAAHWRYKEGQTDRYLDEKLAWLRGVLEWQEELPDADEFMESLRIDIFHDEVFVFTPKGDVLDLPAGSTPIDFAYRIHSEIGHRCTGAKVNGRIVPLDTPLRNGDIVEIMTSKQATGPSADWLNIAQTPSAKNRIRQWFKKQQREENYQRGQELVEKEIRRQGYDSSRLLKDEWLEEIRKRLNFANLDDLWVAVGYGGVSPHQIVNRLRDFYRREQTVQQSLQLKEITRVPPTNPDDVIRVGGVNQVLYRLARCCNPVPGDEIVGYITRGRGVSIHRRDCGSLAGHQLEDGERMIEVTWEDVDVNYYPVEIQVECVDRPGILSEVAQVVADTHTNIITAKAHPSRNGGATIDMILAIRNLSQLDYLCRRLEQIDDVESAQRVNRRRSMH